MILSKTKELRLEKKQKMFVVKNMLAQNMPVAQLCQIAECDEYYVEKIRKERNHQES